MEIMKMRILSLFVAFAMVGGIISVPSYATEVGTDSSIKYEEPFIAITTDAGDILEIENMGTLDYDSYTAIPYYVVTIPEGSTRVDITYPDYEDPCCSMDEENGLYAQGCYMNLEDGTIGEKNDFDYEIVEGGYSISMPLYHEVYDSATDQWTEVSFVGGECVVAIERSESNGNLPIAFFHFVFDTAVYDGGGETLCDHSNTTIYCDHIADTETHTETEICNLCEEQIGESLVVDCLDEDGNLYCDFCNCWVECKHSVTTTEYMCEDGSENHIVIVTCANSYCGDELSRESVDCEDSNSDGMCDACGCSVVVEESVFRTDAGLRLGDLDGDDEVTEADAKKAHMIIQGIADATEELFAVLDVNDDGKVNAVDVAMIYGYVRGKLEAFPKR